uniref:Uncharacterized protein n=1 Tax=Siphoviridae sp. ctLqe90 TaxID=2825456 RepID=A0A8S5Q1D9_9CAUD|nr:MAG TPA: hypothetical protein [Siphoviridae sp. ctLqe90]
MQLQLFTTNMFFSLNYLHYFTFNSSKLSITP